MKVAIIADTHINPTDDASSSVYKVHANANRRVMSVVKKINSLNVDLVIHLGDFVHRIQGQPLRKEAIKRFREILGDLNAPLLLVPGNHDEGEKPTRWAPGDPVTDETLKEYRREFGPDYYFRDEGNDRFICLNSQLLGAGTPEEATQYNFLVSALETSKAKYVFMHHPFYLESEGEREHYDNLPIEVRERYLPLIRAAGVKAVFAGHVHNYFFNVLQDTHLFVVPSTTFVRHDYTELFPFVPVDEAHGRNYASKLGFFLLDTDQGKFGASWVRTFGQTDIEKATSSIELPVCNLLRGDRAAIGVDLRHDWATPRPIPYTALQDEFNRKKIRNDNFTSSIFETGICLLRIPMQDLEEEKSRARMHDLAGVGVRFLVFNFEAPTRSQVALLNRAKDMLAGLEVCTPLNRIEQVSQTLRRSELSSDIRPSFSLMGTSASASEPMAHYIWTGYDGSRAELDSHLELVKAHGFKSCVIRMERQATSSASIERLADRGAAAGILLVVYVRLASTNGAETEIDDTKNAELVSMLEILGRLRKDDITIILDTYADHDRGYYPRTGLVDRAYDPRPAGKAVGGIVGLIGNQLLKLIERDDECIAFQCNKSLALLIPNPSRCSLEPKGLFKQVVQRADRWQLVDLVGGRELQPFDMASLSAFSSKTGPTILISGRE